MQRYIMHFHAPEPSPGTIKMRRPGCSSVLQV
jgi:hypothetical protein